MHRILVAYDGSEPARRALEQAAELTTAMNATLTVMHVTAVHADRVPVDPDGDLRNVGMLAGATRYLAERGVSSDVLERAGDPGPTIVRAADEGGFDTIVVGSRGLGTAARLVLGSVSAYVTTHARVTVVVAR